MLTYFWPMIQFYAPLKHHKTKCFRDIKGKHWPETGSQQIYSEIKYILKNFAGFTGKHCVGVSF